jgi:stage II sporulation protein R
MKQNIILALVIILSLAITFFTVFAVQAKDEQKSDYLRIHVRANSNSEADQEIKYIVKDEVVDYITPYAAECTTKQRALEIIGEHLSGIEGVCNRVLSEHGFLYTSSASIREELFPTRSYGDLTLESGLYDALIIELGSGEGDNWWCVIYPPLCFTAGDGSVEYKSIILEIIKKFYKT